MTAFAFAGTFTLASGVQPLTALSLVVNHDSTKLRDTPISVAMRCLEENLQREGLGDLDKADAVRRAVELLGDEYEAGGRKRHGAAQHVADRLGLDKGWVSQLCEISLSLDNNLRAPVEAGDIVAKTALAAKRWGGDEYEAAGKKRHGALQHVADRLGIAHGWVTELCAISDSLESDLRKPVEAGDIVAKTALAAKRWGGDEFPAGNPGALTTRGAWPQA